MGIELLGQLKKKVQVIFVPSGVPRRGCNNFFAQTLCLSFATAPTCHGDFFVQNGDPILSQMGT